MFFKSKPYAPMWSLWFQLCLLIHNPGVTKMDKRLAVSLLKPWQVTFHHDCSDSWNGPAGCQLPDPCPPEPCTLGNHFQGRGWEMTDSAETQAQASGCSRRGMDSLLSLMQWLLLLCRLLFIFLQSSFLFLGYFLPTFILCSCACFCICFVFVWVIVSVKKFLTWSSWEWDFILFWSVSFTAQFTIQKIFSN